MKILGLLLLTVYSSHLLALTCSESPTINLSDAGGPLENLRVTDQNGMGICHIEQLHKLLKAKIPSHPDFSRVQMAMFEKKSRDAQLKNKKAVRWMSPDLKQGGTYIDAGETCKAYNNIKGSNICLAESDQFEQLTALHPDNQSEILNRMSVYFDGNKKLPQSELLGLLENYGPAVNHIWKNCSVDEAAFEHFKTNYSLTLSSNKPNRHERKYLKNTIAPQSANDTKLTIKEILAGKTYAEKVLETYSHVAESSEEVKKAFDNLLTSYRKTETCLVDQLRVLKKNMLCTPFANADSRLLELNKFGMGMNHIVYLLQGSDDRDQFFLGAFKCAEENRVKVPELNCQDTDLLSMAKKAKSLDEFHQTASAKIDELLAKGSPVGISTCTRFFRSPNSITVAVGEGIYSCGDSKHPQYKKGEGSHAVTIIGSRCVNGEQQYLIQNSWGTGCYYAKEFECTKKGGFWASASSIINNTRTLINLE